jgi:pyruvate,water dikinase
MIGMREDFKSTLSLSQALFGAAARRLSTHFYPAYPDDMMFFYTWHEFLAFGRSKGTQPVSLEIIAQRRAELELNRSLASPPEIIWFNTETRRWRPALKNAMVEVSLAELPQVFNLKGIPASGGSGVVEGMAVVTNDPVEAAQMLLRLNGPAILVTRLTDPAWSSLFLRLTGVVTELGGVISHAAIVARETGLPAVVGVADATRLVRNGQKLRMDGVNGTIDILD